MYVPGACVLADVVWSSSRTRLKRGACVVWQGAVRLLSFVAGAVRGRHLCAPGGVFIQARRASSPRR